MTSGISSLVSSSSTSTSSSSSSTSDATGIANNFSQFLTLLTTQLKNQNPSTRWTPTSSRSSWCSSRASSSN